MKKVYLAMFLLLFFLSSNNIASASSYDEQILTDIQSFAPDKQYDPDFDLSISEKDLNIDKTQILPDNIFYFINSIKNSIQLTFSINKNDQTNQSLKISSEKLKELEKCTLLKTDNEKCIENGVNNYKQSKKDLYNRVNLLNDKEKEDFIEKISKLELNQYIILSQIHKNNSTLNINTVIDSNFNNLSQFIKSIKDNISLKKHIEISLQTEQKLKPLIINEFLNSFKNYLNLEKRNILNEIIDSNNKILVKNINSLDVKKIEKTLQYYFFRINKDDIISDIETLDNFYIIEDKAENSPNKENIKIAILNTKQIPISIFNQKFQKLSINEIDKNLEEIFKGDNIQKINLIELLNKYNNGKKDIKSYQLEYIETANLNLLYKKISDITDSIQKEKYIDTLISKISPENSSLVSLILNQIEILGSSDINTKIVIERIKNKIKEDGFKEYSTSSDSMLCPITYDPVCGNNGKTYNNKCLANKSEIKILYESECRILENEDLKEITAKELENGWYSGNEQQKRPGTPTTWINIDSDTKNAKWIDPKKYTNLKGLVE